MHRGLPGQLALYYSSIFPSLGHDPTISIFWTRSPLHCLRVRLHSPSIDLATTIVLIWNAWMQCMLKSTKHRQIHYETWKKKTTSHHGERMSNRSRIHTILSVLWLSCELMTKLHKQATVRHKCWQSLTTISQASKTTIFAFKHTNASYHNMLCL
jgi:hypothetical protein